MPLVSISLFLLLIFFSSLTDLKYKKIYNYITFPFMIGGFIASFLSYGASGLLFSLYGALLGVVIYFPLFCFGLLGAGDIKLMTAIGSIIGAKLVFLTGIYALASGGIMSILVLLYHKRLLKTIKQAFWGFFTLIHPKLKFELPPVSSTLKTPFAIAIGIGGIIAIYYNF